MAQNLTSRFIRRLRLHHSVSEPTAEALSALPWRIARRSKESHVIREGDEPAEVSVLLSGYAQRQKITSEGTRQIVSFAMPGDPLDFDCLFLGEADYNVQMATDGSIACVRTDALRQLLADNAEASQAVTSALLVDAAIFREWVVNTGRRDARQRIAHVLCEIIVRAQVQGFDTHVFELPYTQDQLADATGLTPVHVNRVLRQLTSEGFIDRNRRLVSIPDWDRLRVVADFNSRFLHMP